MLAAAVGAVGRMFTGMSSSRRKPDRGHGDKNVLGYNNYLWKKKNLDGVWVSCLKSDTDPSKCIDTIIERYERSGRSLDGTALDARRRVGGSSAYVTEAMSRYMQNKGENEIKSHQNQVECLAKVEVFMMHVMPDSPFSQMLNEMCEKQNSEDAVQFQGLTAKDMIVYIDYLCHPRTGIITLNGATGRNVGYPTIALVSTSINNLYKKVPHLTSPFKSSIDLAKKIKHMRTTHEEVGAGSFDFATDLEHLYEGNFGDPHQSHLQKLRDWSMFLTNAAMIGRGSEVCSEFCPDVDTVQLPKDAMGFGADHVPKVVMVGLKGWKGSSQHGKTYTMNLFRNDVDQRYCPVFHLLLWLKLSGIKEGPIYTNIRGTRSEPIIPVPLERRKTYIAGKPRTLWVDDGGKSVGVPFNVFDRMMRRIFKRAGFPQATTHSIRKSACKWAARCGADLHTILSTGRWATMSSHFMKYIEEGQSDAQKYKDEGQKDPIRKVWVFHPCRYHQVMQRQLS